MARQLRIECPGAVYHVTSRGNEKKAIFKGDMDRETLPETLSQVNKRYNWLCPKPNYKWQCNELL